MNQLVVSLLSFLAVICFGAALLLGREQRQLVRDRLRLAPSLKPSSGAGHQGAQAGLASTLNRLGEVATLKRPPGRALGLKLAQAGYYHPSAAMVYLGLKLALAMLGLIAMSILAMAMQPSFTNGLLLIAGGAAALSFLPNLYIAERRHQRCLEVRHHLPDAVDLLEISVSSGMGLDMAWNLVTHEIRHVSPRLADEMALTNLEIHLGEPRAQAMRHMVERTGADELNSLVAVLVQSERFGTSISEVLRVFANTLRELRSQRAEESAEKLAVKLIFPMVLLIFPAVLIVSVGPAFILLSQALSSN